MSESLFIDTSDSGKAIVRLKVGEKEYRKTAARKYNSQVVLDLIDRLLSERKLKIFDIDDVEVKKGPGSFTGLRVGISVANAIGAALGIKINGKKQIVDAKYK